MEKNILPTVFVMVIGRNSAGSLTALDLESKVMNAAAQLTGTSLLIQIFLKILYRVSMMAGQHLYGT
jgi:hypothetical protein